MQRTFIWFLISFITIELGIYILVSKPITNELNSPLSQYFNYGLSIENKLTQAAGNDDQNATNLVKAGWFVPAIPTTQNKSLISIYGMSFSNHIGKIIQRERPNTEVKLYAGPGAPLNHSYTYFQKHRPHKKGSVVILGILASSLPAINSLGHMTHSFEAPAAHFYPRYFLNAQDTLSSVRINIENLSEFRQAINNVEKWSKVRERLSSNDAFYYPTIFEKSITDYSNFAKLTKRALAQKHKAETLNKFHTPNGFTNKEQQIDITRKLVEKFAKEAREDGAIPYIILFNNLGYKDHLYQILSPTLKSNKIPFYSTHRTFPSDNQGYFIPDGHFKPEIDELIAKSIINELELLTSPTQHNESNKLNSSENN